GNPPLLSRWGTAMAVPANRPAHAGRMRSMVITAENSSGQKSAYRHRNDGGRFRRRMRPSLFVGPRGLKSAMFANTLMRAGIPEDLKRQKAEQQIFCAEVAELFPPAHPW